MTRPDDQRAVGFEQFAGQGHEAQAATGRLRASSRAWASFSTNQVRPNNRLASGAKRGCVSTKRSARPEHAGPAVRSISGLHIALQWLPSQTNPTRPPKRCDWPCKQSSNSLVGEATTCCAAWPQGHIDQRRCFDAHVQQVGDQPDDRLEGAIAGASGLGEHFLNARANAFVATIQFFEHGGPFGGRAVTLLQGVEFGLQRRELLLRLGQLLFDRRQRGRPDGRRGE